MELDNKVFFFWRHASMFEAWVEVIHPSKAAALA
jgi:hypothetical protein